MANEPNYKLISAHVQTVLDVLSADRFYRWQAGDENAVRGRISDLRWSVVKLADCIAELCPDEPFASDKK